MFEMIFDIVFYLLISFILIPAFFSHLLKGFISMRTNNVTLGFIYNSKNKKFETDQDTLCK